MLLSIVECSDYRSFRPGSQEKLLIENINEQVEVIGPICRVSAAEMRNAGAEAARGRWIFFKDEDCVVSAKKLERFCAQLEKKKSNIRVVGGIYKNRHSGFVAKVYGFIQRSWVITGLGEPSSGSIRSAKKLLGGALIVHKEVFLESGGFNEQIGWGGEDLEFTNRVRKLGHETGVSFRLLVHHKNELGLPGLIRRAWKQNFNPGYFAFTRNARLSLSTHYFKSPKTYWPLITMFLGVGAAANVAGVITRGLVRVKK